MFTKQKLDSYYFTTEGFYVFFIPIRVPYEEIYDRVKASGLSTKEAFGPIFERGKSFGYGWIGVEVEKPAQAGPNVVHIAGEFEVYEHKGPYRTLGRAYKKIMKERPVLKEFYNSYLDDPKAVSPEHCRTQIFFR